VETSEDRGGTTYTVRRPRRFRQESVWPILDRTKVAAPMTVFEQVCFIARLKLDRAWKE
jgi:hypothetical protein